MIMTDDLQHERAQRQKDAQRLIAWLIIVAMLREFCRLGHLPNGLNEMPAWTPGGVE
jgi:hypothetical protein